MRSAARGPRTFPVEVTNVSPHGFWLFVDDEELFVPFTDLPWLKDVTIGQISRVERPSAHHLYWPELEVDLAVDSFTHPERYPLVIQVQPNKRLQPAKAPRRTATKRPARARLRG